MGPRILIAEPEKQVAEALAAYLHRKLGAACTVVTGYEELVSGAQQTTPDIVLVSSRLTGASKDKQMRRARSAAPHARFILVRDESAKPRVALFASDYAVSKARPVSALIDAVLVMLQYDTAPKRGDRKRDMLWAREPMHPKAREQVGRSANKKPQKFLLPTHNTSHRFGTN